MQILEMFKIECIGTFLYIFISGQSIIQYSIEAISFSSMGMGIFCAVMVSLWMGKSISGSQYNPLVSLSLAITKHQSFEDTWILIVAQTLGSLFGVSMLFTVTPTQVIHSLNESTIFGITKNLDVSFLYIILLEFISSFFLVLVYFILIVDIKNEKHIYAPAIAGLHYSAMILCYPITGGVFNPCKLFSYMFVADDYTRWWAYLLGMTLGGLLGGLTGGWIVPKVRARTV